MTGTRVLTAPPQTPTVDQDYEIGGIYSALVAAIVQQCSCERGHAIAALKVYRNNVDHAVASIARSRSRRHLTRRIFRPDQEKIPVEKSYDIQQSNGVPARISKTVTTTTISEEAIKDEPPDVAQRVAYAETSSTPELQLVTADSLTIPKIEFELPQVPSPPNARAFDPKEGRLQQFSLERLIWAIQNGLSNSDTRQYLAFFQPSVVTKFINKPVLGIPSLFYVVATNDDCLIRTWIEHGADVNVRDPATGLPVLAFAIMNMDIRPESRLIVACTLLGNGADITPIPRFLYDTYNEHVDPKRYHDVTSNADTAWCNAYFQKKISNTLTLSQKYFLRRRARTRAPSSRLIQVASEHRLFPLFSLPFTMIGQDLGIQMLTGRLLTHLITVNDKPLILTFAGPSGHGKTEVAKRLGDLLSLNMLVVDMTQMNRETDLFGPHSPYHGYEKGASLNNFLADNSGKRAIVLLDEIEKAGPKLMDALLIVFDEGRYQDRRSKSQINCTSIIWILTTNALDNEINDFSHSNMRGGLDIEDLKARAKETLSANLLGRMKSEFGAPLSGRVSAIIPFLPFTEDEQMVIAHKYLLDLQSRLYQPIALEAKKLVGQIQLRIEHDVAVCQRMAVSYYDPDRGARSLEAAVKNEIEPKAVGKYLEETTEIVANQPVENYLLDIDMDGNFVVTRDKGKLSDELDLLAEIEAFM